MAISFAYTEATNRVVVTEGTVGTPADPDDFVHFDRTVGTSNSSIPGADVLGGLGDCATDWFDVQGDGWTHDGAADEYDCDGSQASSSLLIENSILTIGVTYKVTYTVKNYTENGAGDWIRAICGLNGFGTARYANGTYTEFITCDGDTHFRTQAGADFIGSVTDITIEPVGVSGAELKAATAVAADTDLTLTYPMRPVEYKALRLAITTAQNGGAAVSGDETVDIFGTTAVWQKLTGASASGQKVVPIADLTHNYQVGDTVILIDISAPSTYETDIIASISKGVSITLTNNNTNSYATGDIVGIYQTEQINTSGSHTTFWSTVPYGQIAMLTFIGYDGTNTAKVDQPIWGVIWNLGNFIYIIDSHFDVGDSNTSTYFKSVGTLVFTVTAAEIRATNAAIWKIGEVSSGEISDNGFVQINDLKYEHYSIVMDGGTLLVYGSVIKWNDPGSSFNHFHLSGDVTFDRSQVFGSGNLGGVRWNGTSDVTVKDSYYFHQGRFTIASAPTTPPDGFVLNQANASCYIDGSLPANLTFRNIDVVNPTGTTYQHNSNAHAYFIDCGDGLFTSVIGTAGRTGSAYRQYTCNITVRTKDGTLLDGVEVLCEDEADAQVFTTTTGDTDTGKIDEQEITYIRYYYDGGNQATTHSPHKFTLSKAGYETLIKDNITVDDHIVWELELQPPGGAGAKIKHLGIGVDI